MRFSTRAVFAIVASGVATALIIIVLFGWPGFLVELHCSPTTDLRGVDYCYESALVAGPAQACPFQANGTWTGPFLTVAFWGFTFHLERYQCGEVGGTAVSVTEPMGAMFYGSTSFGGPITNLFPNWFAPDNESGIFQPTFSDLNVTLYVEASG